MMMTLVVAVPSSADSSAVEQMLRSAAASQQGVTITDAAGYSVDVDMVVVSDATLKEA